MINKLPLIIQWILIGKYHQFLFLSLTLLRIGLSLAQNDSIQIIIDHERQTDRLESVHIENPAELLERLTALELGRRQSAMQINELNLENLFFIGKLKDFVLNNKLINLDSHFVQASDVGFV